MNRTMWLQAAAREGDEMCRPGVAPGRMATLLMACRRNSI